MSREDCLKGTHRLQAKQIDQKLQDLIVVEATCRCGAFCISHCQQKMATHMVCLPRNLAAALQMRLSRVWCERLDPSKLMPAAALSILQQKGAPIIYEC